MPSKDFLMHFLYNPNSPPYYEVSPLTPIGLCSNVTFSDRAHLTIPFEFASPSSALPISLLCFVTFITLITMWFTACFAYLFVDCLTSQWEQRFFHLAKCGWGSSVLCISGSFPFIGEQCSPVWKCLSLLIHSPVERLLDCFQFWVTMHKAAINIFVQVFKII